MLSRATLLSQRATQVLQATQVPQATLLSQGATQVPQATQLPIPHIQRHPVPLIRQLQAPRIPRPAAATRQPAGSLRQVVTLRPVATLRPAATRHQQVATRRQVVRRILRAAATPTLLLAMRPIRRAPGTPPIRVQGTPPIRRVLLTQLSTRRAICRPGQRVLPTHRSRQGTGRQTNQPTNQPTGQLHSQTVPNPLKEFRQEFCW